MPSDGASVRDWLSATDCDAEAEVDSESESEAEAEADAGESVADAEEESVADAEGDADSVAEAVSVAPIEPSALLRSSLADDILVVRRQTIWRRANEWPIKYVISADCMRY